ncbi:MOB kinase activator-like 1A [Andrographis paniculata]|uniref:MOB kinase activator-like 1A n=1 Tax=Andrographis paniculata TaxID=175694 RepID=UPI0021E724D9|nr:MOB kinase activator-like 1A [Andrographis paniculata]
MCPSEDGNSTTGVQPEETPSVSRAGAGAGAAAVPLMDRTASELKQLFEATLGGGSLREAVKLPQGIDYREWLAVNTVDFFNHVNVLYGALTEFCTHSTCPIMSAGPKYEYRWADGIIVTAPIEVTAPEYAEFLLDWIEDLLKDDSIFPKNLGVPFPPNFEVLVKTILKRLFRIYAHIYHSHFNIVERLHVDAHLHTCFKHFVLFIWEFRLVGEAELAPLHDMVDAIVKAEP